MPVYMDNNSTTAPAPEVTEAMLPFLTEWWGNPSSAHTFGNRVRRGIDQARSQVATLIGAEDDGEIIFTSGGSEANNLAIWGALERIGSAVHLITSRTEHAAVVGPCEQLEKKGHAVVWLDVDQEGLIDLQQLEERLAAADTALVSIMWANNETGVISPVEEISRLVRQSGGIYHTDAVQAVGKLPVNLKKMEIDLLSISGHKLHAPKGIGALYIRRGTRLAPLIIGGHQERGRRAGTENVPAIIGLGKACELAATRLQADAEHEKRLRDRLERGILSTCKGASLNGHPEKRLPNTTNISFEQLDGEAILLMLDDADICVSTGSACESGSLETSHVLKAMNVPRTAVNGAIRFSLGRYSNVDDVDKVLGVLPGIIDRCRELAHIED